MTQTIAEPTVSAKPVEALADLVFQDVTVQLTNGHRTWEAPRRRAVVVEATQDTAEPVTIWMADALTGAARGSTHRLLHLYVEPYAQHENHISIGVVTRPPAPKRREYASYFNVGGFPGAGTLLLVARGVVSIPVPPVVGCIWPDDQAVAEHWREVRRRVLATGASIIIDTIESALAVRAEAVTP